MPGATLGLQKEDPTIATFLKTQGYMTAQYGKNHLGDLDEHMPTEHGFDEFFGNLYHLNAEEEPEHVDYPKDPEFRKRFGPRGVIKPGTKNNDFISHLDWFPTLAAATGNMKIKQELKKGKRMGGERYKVHLDGYNFLPYFEGKSPTPRKEFFYFSDTGDLLNLRYNNWQLVFAEQRAHGFDVWSNPFAFLRFPKLFNLRSDPFEHADEIDAMGYQKFRADRMYVMVPAQAIVGEFLATFKAFPPRQKPASFSIDQVMEQMTPRTN